MLNNVMLIGRVTEISEKFNLNISVNNAADERVDVRIFISEGMKDNVKQYLHVGDLVDIKGQLKQDSVNHNTVVLAQKISFLSSASDEAPDASEDTEEGE